MKHLIAFAVALLCSAAFATGKPPATTLGGNAAADAAAAARADAVATGATSTMNSGDAWAVALPGHGAPSYAGQFSICVRGRGVLWNAFWSWEPDTECVKLIAELTRVAATPAPKPAVYPMADSMPAGAVPALADASMPQGVVADAKPIACDMPPTDKPLRTAASTKGNGKPKPQPQKVAAVATPVAGCPR
jgi:hypothetical protein